MWQRRNEGSCEWPSGTLWVGGKTQELCGNGAQPFEAQGKHAAPLPNLREIHRAKCARGGSGSSLPKLRLPAQAGSEITTEGRAGADWVVTVNSSWR